MHTPLWFTIVGFHTLVVFLFVAAFLIYFFPRRLYHILALFIGLLVAFIDQQVGDPQFPALLLLAFGLFLGAMQPVQPWRWALLISVWVPLVSMLRILIEERTAAFINEGVFALIALVPAFLGAYAGKMISSHQQSVSSSS